MADLHKGNAPWEQHIIDDVNALSLDTQIQIINSSIQELAQKRYTALLNAKVFKDAEQEATANKATAGITVLRQQLVDIRRKQEARIRAETQRVLDEAAAVRDAMRDVDAAIQDAEAELIAAHDAADV